MTHRGETAPPDQRSARAHAGKNLTVFSSLNSDIISDSFCKLWVCLSEGRFTVVGQILPSVKLILGVMFISEWPQNDRPFCWSFLSHFLLVKMNLSSKMTSHFFREKCLWPPKWPTLKQVSQSLEISGRNEFDRQNESDRRLWNLPLGPK